MALFSILYAMCSSTGQLLPWGVRLSIAVTSRYIFNISKRHTLEHPQFFTRLPVYLNLYAQPSYTRDVPPRQLAEYLRFSLGLSLLGATILMVPLASE
ncbi:hypothetical protein T01_15328 [Trichinella spiralis]|uniref:Uncharacterized protein n=1 Tax=Trichinella spiralis TaxID=6334 RepID=A0A0V1AWC7_TRISP|nr:hypothetical protein T01_15328 [Trichinella spiralis]